MNFEIKTVNVRWLLVYEHDDRSDSDPATLLVWHGEEVHQLRKRRVTAEIPARLCGKVNEFLA